MRYMTEESQNIVEQITSERSNNEKKERSPNMKVLISISFIIGPLLSIILAVNNELLPVPIALISNGITAILIITIVINAIKESKS